MQKLHELPYNPGGIARLSKFSENSRFERLGFARSILTRS